MGMETIVNLIYSVSPRHTDAYYAQKTREAAAIGPYRICFKDVGGLLTVERARALFPILVQNAGAIPVEFHAHCNNGLAPICCLEAVRQGIKILHTAVPPLANGASQPSVITLKRNLRALGHFSPVDEEALGLVIECLSAVARNGGLAGGHPVEYDHAQYQHQVPGGMISNLRHQLRLVGMEEKLPATLDEAARVRADFGYPIMVTPLSQFVATQAAINVIVGERYKEVTDQVIQYALGLWGAEAPALMERDIKEKILGRRRAKDYEDWRPREVSLQEVRRQYGGVSLSDEELILRVYAGPEAVMAMGSGELAPDPPSTRASLIRVIEALSKRRERNRIFIRTGTFSLTLEKRSGPRGTGT